MNRLILSHRQKLDNLFARISSITTPADQSEWSKYLCVLVSGFIEESLRVLLEEYTKKRASSNIQNFVEKQISNITNCKTSRIIEILGKFSQDWADEFVDQIQTKSSMKDEIKNSIDSVISNRHDIAHGRNVGITYARISAYYSNVKKTIEILEDIIQ
ncbi:MAE_28990/MAE_18760 family HEPN-like nuclease [Floridanema evergladense]|uniref:MAE_28990/MAE_18760 family HEPN-like nuclease n=1 Tax=Floridaenema evergladense BLCC-F167 TaxID=3153639 RepID=A0ABV4WL22_9CYAN